MRLKISIKVENLSDEEVIDTLHTYTTLKELDNDHKWDEKTNEIMDFIENVREGIIDEYSDIS